MTGKDVKIPLMRPLLPPAEALLPYLRDIDETRWYTNFGPMVDRFEKRLAAAIGLTQENMVCVSSGTMGLAICLRSLNAQPGAYCLLPSWTFAATALAVRWAGMEPYFLDVDSATWMLDPAAVAHRLEKVDGAIGAVMPVSAFGAPVDVGAWDEFQARTGIPVVVDSAAGFDGAVFGQAPTVISLHATKVFGIGEGALIASRDMALAARVRAISNFGFVDGRESALPGINAKISEYAAAVGMAALDGWAETCAAFRAAAALYEAAFADLENVALAPGFSSSRACSTCNIRLADASAAEWVMTVLSEKGIASRRWWGRGCHRMPAFEGAPRTALPVTEALADSVVGLPFSQDISEGEIRAVRDAVGGAING